MTDCSNFTGKIGRFGGTVTLHKLPLKPSLKRAWIIAISRKNWTATSYTRVCSDHFKNGVGPNYFDREKVLTYLNKIVMNEGITKYIYMR